MDSESILQWHDYFGEDLVTGDGQNMSKDGSKYVESGGVLEHFRQAQDLRLDSHHGLFLTQFSFLIKVSF